MTALCGGGTSDQKSGTPTVVALGTAIALAYLSRWGSAASWLSNFLSFVNFPTLDLATFCSTDPPAIPTFDANDALAVLSLPVGSPQMATTAAKVSDLIQHLAWYELCECTSGTATALPSPATPPTGAGQVPTQPAAGACATYNSGPMLKPAGAQNEFQWLGLTQLPLGCTSYKLTMISTALGTTHCVGKTNIFFKDQYGVSLNVNPVSVTGPSGTTSIGSFDRDNRAQIFNMTTSWNSGCEDQIESQVDFFCGTASPTGTTVACCPPDDVSLGMLTSILNMVTLMQRQSVPFAYVPGATHSGLSGAGHIDVQGLIGAKITASVPSRAGVDFGDPDTVFDLGWINWGNSDGSAPREKITTSPQLSFPALAGNYTRIGYTIPADVTISILELVREP
jgi:hypothetical protein